MRSPAFEIIGIPRPEDPPLVIGTEAYRRAFLDRFASLPETPLERTEKLEQLRALENGARIRVVPVDRAPPGVDTREDYEAFVRRRRERNA